MLTTKSAEATIGCPSSCAGSECTVCNSHSRSPREPSSRRRRVLSARVTGAPSTRKTGTAVAIVMCWIMCMLNKTRP